MNLYRLTKIHCCTFTSRTVYCVIFIIICECKSLLQMAPRVLQMAPRVLQLAPSVARQVVGWADGGNWHFVLHLQADTTTQGYSDTNREYK